MPSWQKISFSENLTLSFAMPYTGGTALCDLNDCLPSKDGLLASLPPANANELGSSFTLNNISSYSFTVIDIALQTVCILLPGNTVLFYLVDNKTAQGAWRAILIGGTGGNALVSLTITSSGGGIDIKGGEVTPPGGTVDFNIPLSLTNLSKLLSSGLVYANYSESDQTLSFLPVSLTAGNNLVIEQDKDLKNYLLSLSDILTSLSYLETAGLHLENNQISALLDNIMLSTKDSKGKILLNPISIDTDGNMNGIQNLTLSGTLSLPSFMVGDITLAEDGIKASKDKNLALQTSGTGTINLNQVVIDILGNLTGLLSVNGIGLDDKGNLSNLVSLTSPKDQSLSLNGLLIDAMLNVSSGEKDSLSLNGVAFDKIGNLSKVASISSDAEKSLSLNGLGIDSLGKLSSKPDSPLFLNGITIDASRKIAEVMGISSSPGSALSLNSVNIDEEGNVSNVTSLQASGDIEVKGQITAEKGFSSPLLPKAWCCFVDTGQSEDNIILEDSAGVASVTGKNGNYVITFQTPFANANYGFSVSVQKSSGSNFINSVFVQSRSQSSCIVYTVDKQGNLIPSIDALSVQIYSAS